MAKNKKNLNDKFYTKDIVVKNIISLINLNEYDLIIEPSAGNGSFLNYIDKYNYIELDIYPEDNRIIKQDWFNFDLSNYKYNKCLVIGNPPFGNQSKLAISFINKAVSCLCDA